MSDDKRKFLNPNEVAKELGAHPETIRKLCRDGVIPAFKFGRGRSGRWLIRRSDLDKHVDERINQIQTIQRDA